MALNPISQIKANLGIEPNGKVQKFFTNTCYKHMDKYVPMDTGALSTNVDIKSDSITYQSVYAHYMYNGTSKSGKPLNYRKDKHTYAGSYWDRRMVSAEMNDVVKEVQKKLEGKK